MSVGKKILCLLVLILISGKALKADTKDTIRIDENVAISGFGDNP